MSNFALLVVGLSDASFLGAGGYVLVPREIYDSSCDIQGEYKSPSTVEKSIYHVAGQENYLDTVIRFEYGERWFARS
ncbi:hypothetical protein QO002_005592 [Pararhizobium capsulatum DSM 1112]|uniref:Uncharacterized protein n=1 Tax=Pararhizobium capsulatum DSM 1112 TaxID=1121113 RepID=A0ABU0BYP1_9HYPH|nr:hypothetical protein [Pararhizobium capsulatum]MDQ0323386.1 hypothetical protein [Pararhizobium capsulatum DSM 1112]